VLTAARSSSGEFAERVRAIVAQIPYGRVMTYGQIAALAGNARAARIVGGIAHYGNPELPWHRVVNRLGSMASGYPGGRAVHEQHLADEGIVFKEDHYIADLDGVLWRPT
jgi:methylated-DNA-protein-cysteine methyltransferase-like protein